MGKSWSDWLADQIGMLPLHLTGISAVAKAIEVVGDAAAGKTPKASDVIGAAGLIDTDGVGEAISDLDTGDINNPDEKPSD